MLSTDLQGENTEKLSSGVRINKRAERGTTGARIYPEPVITTEKRGFYKDTSKSVVSDNIYENVAVAEDIKSSNPVAEEYFPDSNEVTPLFRLQNNVPSVYVNSSRDFQLLCRLYDAAFNNVMFDADSISDIANTDRCSARVLPLLQTKIGFFSDIDITDEDLRYVLKAFPYLVRNKGSKQAIRQTLYMYMRMNHVESDIFVEVLNKHSAMPYTVLVGLEIGFKDTTILDEVFKYILPTGYTVKYIFYEKVNGVTDFTESDYGSILLTPDIVNSQVRGDTPTFSDAADNLIGSIDTVEVIGNDSPAYGDNLIYGYYDSGTFYADEGRTDTITPQDGHYYIDILTDNTYIYRNNAYEIAYSVTNQS